MYHLYLGLSPGNNPMLTLFDFNNLNVHISFGGGLNKHMGISLKTLNKSLFE